MERCVWGLGLALCGLLFLRALPNSPLRARSRGTLIPRVMAPSAVATPRPRPVIVRERVVRQKAIETIQVGERVLGHNPLLTEAERARLRDPDPATWRRIDFRMRKADGVRLDGVLLRPRAWLETRRIQAGAWMWLDLEEMGAVGAAWVLAVGPCPPIQPGRGSVVTGTFKHQADQHPLSIWIEGLNEPIRCTGNHPFWSEDRCGFYPVEELKPGERVRSRVQGVVRVTRIEARAPERWVYNLEVHGEHVYRVSKIGVLVHNQNANAPRGPGSGGTTPPAPKKGPGPLTGKDKKMFDEGFEALFGKKPAAPPTPRPDLPALSGGRSGSKVKGLTGPPNSVLKGSEGRIFITNEKGQVILDITKDRAKPVVPGRGFGPKRPPTPEELDLINKLHGGP